MSRNPKLVVMLPLLLLGCKPEEAAETADQNDPTEVTTEMVKLASGEEVIVQVPRRAPVAQVSDPNTPLHLLTQLVLDDPFVNELQMSERIDPKTGQCAGPDVFSFSGPDKMLWIDLPELKKGNDRTSMVRADFLISGTTLRATNAHLVDVAGVPNDAQPDRSFELQKVEAGGLRIGVRLVYQCRFTMGDAVR